ncbi:MAG: hypothetical protein LBI19_03550 [Oscillospiraceae bacterium]|nr:hypothetical protein [Oscillospiraceae bacterium]
MSLEKMDDFFNTRAGTYDTPFTAEVEMRLLAEAGFSDVRFVREWESASIIIAKAI